MGIDDEYIEPTKVMKYRDSNSNKGLTVHGQAFRPSGSNPKKYFLIFFRDISFFLFGNFSLLHQKFCYFIKINI